jgi:hypothetical protein
LIFPKYQQAGQLQKGLQLFSQMEQEDIISNDQTFVSLFVLCGKLQDQQIAFKLYNKLIISSGKLQNEYSASAAISMFVKCGLLEKARQISSHPPIFLFLF